MTLGGRKKMLAAKARSYEEGLDLRGANREFMLRDLLLFVGMDIEIRKGAMPFATQ